MSELFDKFSTTLNKLPNDVLLHIGSFKSNSLTLIKDNHEINNVNEKILQIKNFANNFTTFKLYINYTTRYKYDCESINEYEIIDKNTEKDKEYFFNDKREIIQLELIKHNIHFVNYIKYPCEIIDKIKIQFNYFYYMIDYYYYFLLFDELKYSSYDDYDLDIDNFYYDLYHENYNNFLNNMSLIDIQDLHDLIQKYIIDEHSDIIKLIKNISVDFQLKIFKEKSEHVELIQNLTCMEFIEKQSDEYQLNLIENYISNIRYFKNMNNTIKSKVIDLIHIQIINKDINEIDGKFLFSFLTDLNTELQLKICNYEKWRIGQ